MEEDKKGLRGDAGTCARDPARDAPRNPTATPDKRASLLRGRRAVGRGRRCAWEARGPILHEHSTSPVREGASGPGEGAASARVHQFSRRVKTELVRVVRFASWVQDEERKTLRETAPRLTRRLVRSGSKLTHKLEKAYGKATGSQGPGRDMARD